MLLVSAPGRRQLLHGAHCWVWTESLDIWDQRVMGCLRHTRMPAWRTTVWLRHSLAAPVAGLVGWQLVPACRNLTKLLMPNSTAGRPWLGTGMQWPVKAIDPS